MGDAVVGGGAQGARGEPTRHCRVRLASGSTSCGDDGKPRRGTVRWRDQVVRVAAYPGWGYVHAELHYNGGYLVTSGDEYIRSVSPDRIIRGVLGYGT